MGEEEKKKPEEEKKLEEPKPQQEGKEKEGEEKKEEEGDEEKKDDPPPPPPPEEIIMRVYMHCEGCARKVQRSLKGFEGVEEVSTDCRTHKVVVKGQVAAADPLKVVERVQKKTGRKVDLLTPIPPKPEKKKEEKKEEEKPKPEEKKDEPVVLAVVMKVHMHCEACSLEIKKRILKMKGVQSVEPELKASEVTVKGVFDPPKLVQYIYKRIGKHAVVIKQDPEKKPDEKPSDEPSDKDPVEKKDAGEKKESGEETAKKDGDADKPKEGDGGEGEKDGKDNGVSDEAKAAVKIVELKKNEFQYYYPRYPVEYAYPPQIFSDENPNACTIM